MSSPLRRLAATAVLALAATALTVPLATPAQAVVPNQTSFLVVDTDGDFTYGLYTMPTPTGTQTPVTGVADSPLRDVFDLTASRSGGRVAYVLDTYASITATTPSSEQVVVRDQGGQLVRVVASVSPSTAGLFSPALSPDGNTVLWNQASASGVVLRRADIGTGVTSTVSTSVADVVYADGDTLFGFSTSTGYAVALPAAGGAQSSINIPKAASQISVAPALNYVAWTLDKSTSSATIADVQWATLDLSTNTVGAATTLATGQNNHSPSWDVQNSRVDYIHDDGAVGLGDVKDVDPTNPPGTVPTTVATPAVDEQEIDIVQSGDAVAPGSATALPAVLNGTSATVKWSLPVDSDLSGVLVSRNGGTTKYVPKQLRSYTDTGLTLNTTYSYSITTVDRSGNPGIAAVRSVTAIKAGAIVSDPTSATSAHLPFGVKFAATGTPSTTKFTVDYLVGGTTTWTRWVTNTAGLTRTFGSAGTTGVNPTTSTAGTTYSFRVQATDTFGNSSPYVYKATTVVPFDQTKAVFSGGHDAAANADWLGSLHVLGAGNTAKISFYGNRLQVIGARCTSCGIVDIYLGSTHIAAIDTYRSVNQLRTVLYTKTWTTVGGRTLTLKARGTAGHPNVMLDGFGVRR